jgi:hemolysin III
MATAVAAEVFRPRMRGWLHAYAAVVSLVTGAALVAVSGALRGDEPAVSTSVYAAMATLLFTTSACYHRINWRPRAHALMKRLDHSMIFLFIAGTYTPIAVTMLPPRSEAAVLTVVWAGALVGVALQIAWPGAPRLLSVACYIALGWVAVFVMPDLLHHGGVAVLVLICAGGLIYTLGGIVYGLKRPDPWPGTFGFHEIFHTCTLVAAACQYIAIWLAVFR